MKKSKALILFFSILISCKTAQKSKEDIIFSVGDTQIPTKEFLYVYNKNNFKEKEDTVASKKEYLDLFINFKLKVKEAEKQGLDTTKSFRDEFDSYKKQLVQPYLTDKKHLDSMVREAYERQKKEVNASHILIPVAASANPSDTLKAFNYITELRNKVLAGEDFGQLAQRFSGDSSARFNLGNLGYFTAMQMVYPFETMAYSTKVGEVSFPVRTQFGYHIIKVNNIRPAQGKVHVAHLMVRTSQDNSPKEAEELKKKTYGIYDQLKKGANWNDMVKQFSEDLNSKDKGGEMDWFGVGAITPSFEDASFALKNPGDLASPIQTPYGWHIIKLIEKKPLEAFEELQSSIKSKINKESRSQASKDLFISKLKNEYHFKENAEGIRIAQTFVDSLNKNKKIPVASPDLKNKVLFELDNKSYKTGAFYAFLSKKNPSSVLPNQADYYKEFVNQTILDYEETKLPEKYEDFRMLVKEYREGILLFTLMDEHVWSKAVKDTVGLKNYFEKNKEIYNSREMADVVKISFADSLDLVKAIDSLKLKGNIETFDLNIIKANLNKKDPLRVDIERDSLENNNEDYWKTIPWKKGEYITKINGRHTYFKIIDIFKPTNRNFEDIRGQVISDYQKYLEDEWIKELKKKYPVQINQKELKRLGLAE